MAILVHRASKQSASILAIDIVINIDEVAPGDRVTRRETVWGSCDEFISDVVRSLCGCVEVIESRVEVASLGYRSRRRDNSSRESEDERSEVHCDC